MPSPKPQPSTNSTPVANAFFSQIDVNDCLDKDQLYLLNTKKLLSLQDYEDWLLRPHRGAVVSEEKKRFMRLLFSALDNNAAVVNFDLDKYGFDLPRQQFETSFIQYAYHFFDRHVQDFCIGRSWISETCVCIKLNPTAGKTHGHRKSYR